MTVYPDEVFFLNTLLDFLLLGTAGLLSDGGKRRLRTVLAALFGGLYAAFASVFAFLSSAWLRLLAAAVLCLLAYGTGKTALRQTMLFLLVCCGFGGLVLLVAVLQKSPVQFVLGMPYFTVSKRMLILLAGLLYCAVFLTMRRLCRHFGELVSMRFCLQGHSTEVTALCDTGNTLKDSVTGQSVIIADLKTAQTLFPHLGLTVSELLHPAVALQKIMKYQPEAKPRLLPFRTVGKEGILLAVRCDGIEVNRKKTDNHILAFSASAFSGGENYRALTGGNYESNQAKNNPLAFGVPSKGVCAVYRRKRYSATAAGTVGGAAAAAKNGTGR